MTVHVLLGIGGTGAKIVESALYMLAAGVGPEDRVHVGLIDQDNSNGNLGRTRDLLASLVALRRDFGEGGNRLDRVTPVERGGAPFLRTEILPLFGDTPHWRPSDTDAGTLAGILQKQHMGEDEKALFDLLFRPPGSRSASGPDEEEQAMDLSQGYRGRAHVGAAALIDAIHFENPRFKTRMAELMKASGKGEEVRIFLCGSIFGGTGAAGFPTIARTLNDMRQTSAGTDIVAANVHIGGALMLPYFAFRDPGNPNANVVRDTDLLPQSKVALGYYHRLFGHEPVFDRLYVAGWNQLFDLCYHRSGSKDQRNPALVPELLGALAAMEFLTADTIVRKANPLVSARREEGEIRWDDLPGDPALKRRLYDRMGRLLRGAVWWRYRIEPALDNKKFGLFGSVTAGVIKVDWLKGLARGMTPEQWQKATPQARTRLTDMFERLLEWAGAMQLFSEDKLRRFGLWDASDLLAQRDANMPTDPVRVHVARSETESAAALHAMLEPSDPQTPPRRAEQIYADLHTPPAPAENAGLGRILSAVQHAARPFERDA